MDFLVKMQPKQLLCSGFAETSVVCVGLLYYRGSPVSTVSVSAVPGFVSFVNSTIYIVICEFPNIVQFLQKFLTKKVKNPLSVKSVHQELVFGLLSVIKNLDQ